jgi:hypothetical protein
MIMKMYYGSCMGTGGGGLSEPGGEGLSELRAPGEAAPRNRRWQRIADRARAGNRAGPNRLRRTVTSWMRVGCSASDGPWSAGVRSWRRWIRAARQARRALHITPGKGPASALVHSASALQLARAARTRQYSIVLFPAPISQHDLSLFRGITSTLPRVFKVHTHPLKARIQHHDLSRA